MELFLHIWYPKKCLDSVSISHPTSVKIYNYHKRDDLTTGKVDFKITLIFYIFKMPNIVKTNKSKSKYNEKNNPFRYTTNSRSNWM